MSVHAGCRYTIYEKEPQVSKTKYLRKLVKFCKMPLAFGNVIAPIVYMYCNLYTYAIW